MRRLLLLIFSLMLYVNGWAQPCSFSGGGMSIQSPNGTICPFSSSNLTVQNAPNNSTYLWSTGATTASISVSPATTTTYTVTVTCQSGATASQNITLNIFAVTIDADVVNGPNYTNPNSITINCGQSVDLSGNGAGGNNNYDWLNPNIPNQRDITVSPTQTTSYYVVGDNNGCRDTDTIVVNVTPLNNASFTFTPNNVCSGTPIQFTNTTIGSNLNYSWNFNDGTPNSSQQNPSHIFNYTGSGSQTYNVVLTISPQGSGNGCNQTFSRQVTVFGKPDAALDDPYSPVPFQNCGTGVFDLYIDNVSSTSATNTNYYIDWGDNTAPYNSSSLPNYTLHSYSGTGYFTITHIVTGPNGCKDTTQYTVFNGTNPAVGLFSNGSSVLQCLPATDTIYFSGISNNPVGTTYTISINDGSADTVLLHPPPPYFIHTFDTTSCGATGGFVPNSFIIKVKAENPCGTSFASFGPVTTVTPPDANFTISQNPSCINNLVTFTNTSLGGVAVDNAGNCNANNPLGWKIIPNTGFTVSSGALGTIPPISSFGGGTPTLGITFTTPGTYLVKLYIRDTVIAPLNCRMDSITQTICIVGPPTPAFNSTPSLICAPDTLFLNNTSTLTTSCDVPTYNWTISNILRSCPADSTKDTTFVNGTTLTSFNPRVLFNNQGDYLINLSVTNVCGTFNAPSDTITVKRKPIASFNIPPSICVNQSVNLATTFQGCGDTTRFFWTIPGGNIITSTAQNPGAVTFANQGTYIIKDSVVNSCGAVVLKDTLVVFPLPVPVVRGDTICVGQQAIVVASGGTSYLWSTGSTNDTLFVSPITTTTYTVTVTNANSCSASASTTVLVNQLPPVTITPNLSTICAGSSAILTAGGANTYLWSPGGSTSNPLTVTLNNTSTYTVTGTNISTGCTNTATTTINVNQLPVITTSPSNQTVCSGVATSAVTWTSSITPSTYSWTLVSATAGLTGYVSTPPNGTGNLPSMTIINPGSTQGTVIYSVTPTANNCPGTPFLYTINVNPLPNVNLPASQTICSSTSSAVFNLTSNLSGTTFSWTTITNGITGVTALNTGNTIPVQTLINPTNNPLTVIYNVTPTSTAGCVGTTQAYSIVVNPSPTVTLPAPQTICSAGSTSLVNLTSSSTGANISWTCTPPANISGALPSGTNTIPVQTLINSTNAPIVVNYIVTATTTGSTNCPGQPVTYSITVNPTPVLIVTPAASSICSGSNTSITMLSSVTGSTYTWTITASGVTGASANGTATSNTTISQALSNATNTQGTVTYTVNVSANNCPGNTATSIVTVQPVATTQFTPAPQTICSGDSSRLITLSSNVTGVNYAWTVTPGSVVGPPQPSSSGTTSIIPGWPSLTNSSASPQTVNITATSTINGCPGPQANYVITVNPLPIISNTLIQTICSGASSVPVIWATNVSGSATYSWSVVNPPAGLTGFTNSGTGNLPSMAITNSGNTTLSLVYAVITTSNNCTGQAINYTIVVNPEPTVNAIPGQAICSNSSIVAVTPTGNVANTTFNWTVTPPLGITPVAVINGPGTIPAQQWVNTTNAPITLNYIVTPTANGCDGDTIHFSVIVYPSPTVTLPAPQTICSGNPTTLVNLTSSSTGASITWTCAPVPGITGITASGTNTIPAQTLINTSNIPVTVNYIVTATTSGSTNCPGQPVTYSITVNPTPVLTVTPAASNICSGASTSLTMASNVTGSTFTWTIAASGVTGASANGTATSNTTISQALSNATNTQGTVTYTVNVSANNCPGNTATSIVTVQPVATTQFTPAPQTICSGDSSRLITLSSNVTGVNYAWTVTPGSVVGPPQPSSSGTTSIIPGWPSLTNSTALPQTVNITATSTINGCPGPQANYTITVNPLPTITNTLAQSLCSGANTTVVNWTTNVTGATTFNWSVQSPTPPGLGGYTNNGTGNIPVWSLTNSTPNPLNLVVQCTATSLGCSGSSFNYTFTVNPAPQVQVSAPNDTICSGDATQIVTLTSTTTNAVITWSAAVVGPVSVGGLVPTSGTTTIPNQTLTNTSSQPIVVDYTINIVTGGSTACPGGTQHYYVVVNPKPAVTFNPATQTICSGSSTAPITISSTTPNTSISWTCTPPVGISGAQTSGIGSVIPAQTLVNTTSSPITVYYVAEAVTSVGLCPGKKDSAAVIVNPIPLAIANPVSDTICSATSTNIALTSDVTGATFTWSSILGTNITSVPTTGSGSTISQTLANTGTTLDSVVYTITPRANNCDGLPINVTVYVQPKPRVTFSSPNQVLCDSSTTSSVTLNSTVSNVVYSWSLNANGITGFVNTSGAGTIPSETIYLPSNSTNTVTATYTATASIGGCPGPDSLYKVTLFPIPRVTGSSQQIICSDTSSTVVNWSNNINAGLFVSYNWSILNSATTPLTGFLPDTIGYGNLPSWLLNNPTANNETLFVQVIPYSHPTATDSCDGIPFIYQIVVNPSPQVDLSAANDTICSGDASQVVTLSSATTTAIITWSASVITGNVVVLNVTSGTTTIPSQVFNNLGTAPAVVEYTIKITTSGGGCNGGTRKYYVVVNPTPTVAFNPATQTICSGSSTAPITISSTTPNTSISWTCTPPVGISGAQTSGIGSVIPAQTLVNTTSSPITVYYVAEAVTSVGLCPGKKDSAAVIVNPIPLAIANPVSDTICSATSTNIALTSDVTGATFTWSSILGTNITSVPTTGSGSTISQTLANTGTTLDSVVYTITPRANNCDGLPINVTVYVQPKPRVTFSSPNQVLCDSSTTSSVTLNSTVSNVVYSWSLNANGITGFVNTSGAGTIPSETIYLPSNSTNTVTATYTATASIGGCPGPDSLYKVTLFPIPRVTGSSQQIICSDTSSSVVNWSNNINAGLSVSYNWSIINSATTTLTGFLPTTSGYGSLPSWLLNNPTANNDTLFIQVTPYTHPTPTDSCNGIPFIYQIVVNPSPQVDLSAPNDTICSGDASQVVTLSSATNNAIITWNAVDVPTGSVLGLTTNSGTTTIPSETLTNNGTVPVYVEYTINITTLGGLCNGGTRKYYVVVNPTPTVTFSPAPQTICSGSLTAPVTISSTTPNTSISWTCTPPTGITGAQTSGNGSTIPAQTLVNTTSAPITIYYVAEAVTSVGLCPGKKDSAAVIVNPIPLAIANPVSDTICSATSTNIALTSDVTGATFTWSSVLGTNITSVPTTGSGNSISQTLTNTGTDLDSVVYTITPRANNCDGLPINVTVYVQPIPHVTFSSPNQVLCDSSRTSLVTLNSTVANVVYNWSLNSNGITGFVNTSGAGSISPETIYLPLNATANVSAVYTANASIDGCPGPDSTYTVTLYPIANITGPNDQTICSGQNILPVNWQTNVTVPTTYNWQILNTAATNVGGYSSNAGFGNIPAWTLTNPNPPNPNPDTLIIQVTPYTHPTPSDSCQGIPYIYTIVVNPAPSVNISAPNDTICSGDNSQLVQLSSATNNISISWLTTLYPGIIGLTILNGTTTIPSENLVNTTPNPISIKYTIRSITTGAAACPGVDQFYYVVVNPYPLVTFNQPNQVICSGSSTLPVTINTTSPNTVISWSVTTPFGIAGLTINSGGDTIPSFTLVNNTFNPITITFAAWGTTVSESCVGDTNYYTITVNPIPPAFASPSDTTICSNTAATIQLSSPVPGTIFSWTFGPNPFITGASNGNGNTITQTLVNSDVIVQTMTYYITPNASNCPGSPITATVNVNPAKPVIFNPGNQSLCSNETSILVYLSSPISGVTYSWTCVPPASIAGTIASGTDSIPSQNLFSTSTVTPIPVTYNAIATFDGCPGPATPYTITVNPTPVPSFTLDTVICKNVSYVFGNTTSTTASTSYTWDFGDGANSTATSPSHAYNAGGVYTITLVAINQYGCDSSYIRTVRVVEPPVAQFVESPREGCGPLSVTFTDQSTGYLLNPTYNWNFGNGTTANTQGPHTVIYNASLYQDTLYLVTQTVGNLCGSTTYIDSVIVHPTPTAYFGTNLSSGCSPLTISFSNNSYGLPTSFLWNFGDGTTDTSRVPAPHTFYAYTQDTVYYISLIAINDCGTNTYVDSILVHPNTTNAFFNTIPDKGCAPLTVTFTNYSIGGTIYAWNFGDGNVSNQYNTTHTYVNPGTYTASFIITNNCSYDTAYVSIEVWPQPTLSFTSSVDTVCINSSVQFNNTSATPLTNIIWDFGDGFGSTLTNPLHTYNSAGTFLVSMIGTGGIHGCSDTSYKYVVVKPLPIAAYDSLYFEGCQPFLANFVNQSTGGVSGVLWDFGDGNTSAAFNATHVYLNAGIFYPLLTVQTQYGCIDTARGEVIVHPKPTSIFTFSPDSSCGAPVVVQFNNQSILGSGASWSFTDGQTSTQISPAMNFTQVGTIGVQLIAISDFGCKDTSSDQFVVYPEPIADIAVVEPRGCEDFTPVFINNSSNAISYLWTFGDGFMSTDQLPIHTYTDDGNYTVTLSIEGLGGCKDSTTLSSTITVIPGPTADFSYTLALNPSNYGWVYFTNLSVYDVSWLWDFDDNSTSTLENPDHQFNANGVYDVELIAYAANGCTDTIVKPIKPTYFDGLFVPNAFAPDKGNSGEMYRVFYPQGKSLTSYHVWVYDTFGILIWESTALKDGSPSEWWDGKRDGSLLPSDVYIWKVEATFENGDIWPGQHNLEQGLKRITGNVTLIR